MKLFDNYLWDWYLKLNTTATKSRLYLTDTKTRTQILEILTYYIAGDKINEHTYLYSITETIHIIQMPRVKLDVIVQNIGSFYSKNPQLGCRVMEETSTIPLLTPFNF